jgi:choline dehydrogenase-like flavoprotein
LRRCGLHHYDDAMIADARAVSRDETVETDVCIVGAGVAGLTLAREFLGQGFQVLLLESGDLKPDADTQSLYRGDNVGYPYYRLDEARARFFGGSANYWEIDLGQQRVGVRLRPLDPIDFEPRDWVPYSGWPLDRSHLDPFYDRAQALFQIEPTTYDVAAWGNDRDRRRLPFTGDDVETIIFKIGYQDVFLNRCRNEVVNRDDNVIVLIYANVVDIETNDTARTVSRLRVACLGGSRFWVNAKIVILAAGGIEVPRLLLLSNRTQKTGLGNPHDVVGRFFMEHPHFWSGLYVPRDQRLLDSMALYKSIHAVDDVPVVGKLALAHTTLRREKLLNQNIQLMPRVLDPGAIYPRVVSKSVESLSALRSALARGAVPDQLGRHLGNVISGPDDIARAAYRKVRRELTRRRLPTSRIHVFRLAHMTEQVPNPDSRVTLGTELDSLGQTRVRLDWRLSPIDILSVVRTQTIVDSELRRAGLGRLYTELRDETPPSGEVPWGVHGGYHHMGTTRMHYDPRQVVVDRNCQVHGMSNLFIAGPSVFPTSGHANPVLTLVALAVRLADHVKEKIKGGAV